MIEKNKTSAVVHPIPPFFDEKSKILILGSFPSVKSREEMFFYGHPQNRFWRTIAAVYGKSVPQNIREKKELLKELNIAVWDVIGSCEICKSSDSSIKNVKANDLSQILKSCNIEKIFVNGKTAEKYYKKYIEKEIDRKAVCLPSTSPANAAFSLERLIETWKCIL